MASLLSLPKLQTGVALLAFASAAAAATAAGLSAAGLPTHIGSRRDGGACAARAAGDRAAAVRACEKTPPRAGGARGARGPFAAPSTDVARTPARPTAAYARAAHDAHECDCSELWECMQRKDGTDCSVLDAKLRLCLSEKRARGGG